MKQNKYFSPQRFVRLFKNDLLINQKAYLFAFAGLSLAVYGFTYFIMRADNSFDKIQDYTPLIMMYMMAIGIVIGTAFPALNNQIKTSNYLLSPGSTFEKFMVQFVIRIIIFIPLALIIFWIGTHLAKVSQIPDPEHGFDPSRIPYFHFSDLFNAIPTLRDRIVILVSIFSVASVLFAGSVYFNRFALVKTLIISGICIFAVVVSFVILSHLFYPAETHGFRIQLKTYKVTETLYNVQLAAYLLGCLSWIFFLVLGYFKLKEKEV